MFLITCGFFKAVFLVVTFRPKWVFSYLFLTVIIRLRSFLNIS